MTDRLRLTALHKLNREVIAPNYDRNSLRAGIVHIGVSNFHRAHQAVYLDKLFNLTADLDWAIVGAGVTAADAAMRVKLGEQNWLSSVTELADARRATRVCGAMIDFVDINAGALLAALLSPDIRIVTLTVTEGGYFLNESSGEFNHSHPQIIQDIANLKNATAPQTVFGVLIAACARRKKHNIAPLTILSCDNLCGNGDIAKQAVVQLAAHYSPKLSAWINANIAFPNCMVDCITPATGAREIELAQRQLGMHDAAPVVCEPHRQWIIEDHFPGGRPKWEEVGAQFVESVAPYEAMKLRVVNAGHACIAYAAALLGVTTVHDAMRHPLIAGFLHKVQTREILPGVQPPGRENATAYFELTKQRFLNSAINDSIARLCGDGSNRQPKFIFPTINERLTNACAVDGLALEVALWCRYCAGVDEFNKPIAIEAARARQLTRAAHHAKRAPTKFLQMRDIFGDMADRPVFAARFTAMLNSLWQRGVANTLRDYLGESLPNAQ